MNSIEQDQIQASQLIQNYYNTQQNHFSLNEASKQSTNIMKIVFQRMNELGLQKITITNIEANDEGVSMMLESNLNKLEDVHFYWCKIQRNMMKKLVEKKWQKLKKLDFNNNTMDDASIELLFKKLPNTVQVLILYDIGISSISLKYLVISNPNNFENIRSLHLGGMKLKCQGIQYITKGNLPKLQNLDLCECELYDESIKEISKAYWPNLQKLSLKWNFSLTQRCLNYFERAYWKLSFLEISLCGRLSIFYFSFVLRPLLQKIQLNIQLGYVRFQRQQIKSCLRKINIQKCQYRAFQMLIANLIFAYSFNLLKQINQKNSNKIQSLPQQKLNLINTPLKKPKKYKKITHISESPQKKSDKVDNQKSQYYSQAHDSHQIIQQRYNLLC